MMRIIGTVVDIAESLTTGTPAVSLFTLRSNFDGEPLDRIHVNPGRDVV